jgi:hypothetical protein
MQNLPLNRVEFQQSDHRPFQQGLESICSIEPLGAFKKRRAEDPAVAEIVVHYFVCHGALALRTTRPGDYFGFFASTTPGGGMRSRQAFFTKFRTRKQPLHRSSRAGELIHTRNNGFEI